MLHVHTFSAEPNSCLAADISKAGETVQAVTGWPLPLADAAFVAAFGGLCFAGKPSLAPQSAY
jgi:hypothetical protein